VGGKDVREKIEPATFKENLKKKEVCEHFAVMKRYDNA